MEGRKKVREERQRGKRNKEEWKIEREGRNREQIDRGCQTYGVKVNEKGGGN